MRRTQDSISDEILVKLKVCNEPLETAEVVAAVGNETRTKILYRLNQLRADGKIKGKAIGCGKGTWIWWCMNEKD